MQVMMICLRSLLAVLLFLCCGYRVLYLLVPFLKKQKQEEQPKLHRYGVLICARNEQAVIAQLIDTIHQQDYPDALLQVFVAADNCTDDTAEVARRAGAVVFERQDQTRVGKGYALQFLLEHIGQQYGKDAFDGYFVFDADNLLDKRFISEMNKVFSQGYSIVTGYRNSKNYGDNWLAAGSALRFLQDSQYLNRSRMLLGISCTVAGTGFLFAREVLDKSGGWTFHTLTEDSEFTHANVLAGERIGYCETAVLYDEQPITFRQSCRQRIRWIRGYLQVFQKYAKPMLLRMIRQKDFACYDILMGNLPAMVLTAANVLLILVTSILTADWSGLLYGLLGACAAAFLMGAVTLITEWRRIYCSAAKKIGYLLTYPLYILTNVPIAVMAVFAKAEWKPIHHDRAVTLEQLQREEA